MGSCCTGRESPTGTAKGAKGKTTGGTGLDSKDTPGVKFKTMDPVRNSIIKILKEDANREIIVLTIPMAHFYDFVNDL